MTNFNLFNLLFVFFTFPIFIVAQQLTDDELTDGQTEFLITFSNNHLGLKKINANDFYEYYKGKKTIRIHGNIESNRLINDISLLATLPDLEHLILTDCSTKDFSALKTAPNLNQLDIINHQGVILLSSISEITQLEKLTLSNNKHFTTNSLTSIENLTKLKKLILNDLPITDISALSNLTSNIQEITVNSLEVKQTGSWALLTSLKGLEFYSCNLKNTTFIKYNSGLESLTISHSEINTVDLMLNNLKNLIISSSNITSLGNIKEMSKLEELVLDHNQLTDVTELKNLKNLTSINISHNNIREVCSLSGNLKIQSIDISYNPIEEFSCLIALPNLQKLVSNHSCYYCNPKDLDDLRNGVNCNIFEKTLLWFVINFIYINAGIIISLILWYFLKKSYLKY